MIFKILICLSFASLTMALFPNCQFNWIKGYEMNDAYNYSQFDGISVWINMQQGCCNYTTDFNPYFHGKMIQKVKTYNKLPVFYAYVIAFEARWRWGLKDCDVGEPSLCTRGAEFVRQHRSILVQRYDHWAFKIAEQIGKNAEALFLIETDFYQYYGDTRQINGSLTGPYMRALYDDFSKAIRKHLPNAKLSWDICFWITKDKMAIWWDFFKSSPYIDFINTSDGVGRGDSDWIRFTKISYSYMNQLTGRKIITDCGYGVAGAADDGCKTWNNQANVNARMQNGVIAVVADFKPTYKPKLPGC